MNDILAGLPSLFCDTLGRDVNVTPSGGSLRTIRAIFTARPTDDLGLTQGGPAIAASVSDVADLADGDLITVGGIDYEARTFRPDGQGMITIELEAK